MHEQLEATAAPLPPVLNGEIIPPAEIEWS